jgi:hypothetical protein
MNYNIKEFKELRDRYNSITLEEIENIFKECDENRAYYLTGFGNDRSCTLCKSAREGYNCEKCIWWWYNPIKNNSFDATCQYMKLAKTYYAIDEANTPKELLKAFRNRAKLMTEVINKYEFINNEYLYFSVK